MRLGSNTAKTNATVSISPVKKDNTARLIPQMMDNIKQELRAFTRKYQCFCNRILANRAIFLLFSSNWPCTTIGVNIINIHFPTKRLSKSPANSLGGTPWSIFTPWVGTAIQKRTVANNITHSGMFSADLSKLIVCFILLIQRVLCYLQNIGKCKWWKQCRQKTAMRNTNWAYPTLDHSGMQVWRSIKVKVWQDRANSDLHIWCNCRYVFLQQQSNQYFFWSANWLCVYKGQWISCRHYCIGASKMKFLMGLLNWYSLDMESSIRKTGLQIQIAELLNEA